MSGSVEWWARYVDLFGVPAPVMFIKRGWVPVWLWRAASHSTPFVPLWIAWLIATRRPL